MSARASPAVPPADAAPPDAASDDNAGELTVFDLRKQALDMALQRGPQSPIGKVMDEARAFALFLNESDPEIDVQPEPAPKRRKRKLSGKALEQARANAVTARAARAKKRRGK
jgi:hypothetical protein